MSTVLNIKSSYAILILQGNLLRKKSNGVNHMEKTMFRVKTFLFTVYDLLCLYTATFCAYVTVKPVGHILRQTKFPDYMLEMHDFYPIAYVMAVIIGGGCCIFLCIEYSKKPKVFVPLLISLVIHPIVIFSMSYIYVLSKPTIEITYWFFIACTIAVIVYSGCILYREKRELKTNK